jgi:lactate permease
VPTPHKEAAVYLLNLLSTTGTGILLSAVLGTLAMQYHR